MRRLMAVHDIYYQETPKFTGLIAAVVAVGKTAMISIKEHQTDAEKVFASAFALGQIATGNVTETALTWMKEQVSEEGLERAQRARVWAAHLLVDSSVYDEAYAKAQDDAQAVAETAAQLNIPESAVRTWLDTRGVQFDVAPADWLAIESPWYALPATHIAE